MHGMCGIPAGPEGYGQLRLCGSCQESGAHTPSSYSQSSGVRFASQQELSTNGNASKSSGFLNEFPTLRADTCRNGSSKRVRLSFYEKLKAIELAETAGIRKAAQVLGIGKSTLRAVKRMRKDITVQIGGGKQANAARGSGKSSEHTPAIAFN